MEVHQIAGASPYGASDEEHLSWRLSYVDYQGVTKDLRTNR